MITAEYFEKKTGRAPEKDDLERANCDDAGSIGHNSCGWCKEHDKPRFECGCFLGLGKLNEPTITQEQTDLCVDCVALLARLWAAELYETAHLMGAVVKSIGYEVEKQRTGQRPALREGKAK